MSDNRPGSPIREDAERLAAGRTLVHLDAVDFAGILALAEPLAVTLRRLAKWEHRGRLGPTGGDMQLQANEQWAALEKALAAVGLADRNTAWLVCDMRRKAAAQALVDLACDTRRGHLANSWRQVGNDGETLTFAERQGPDLTRGVQAKRLAVAVELLREVVAPAVAREIGESAPNGPVPAGSAAAEEIMATLAAVIGGETAAAIFAVARDKSKTVDQRQRDIYILDNRVVGWDGKRWATLLDVTDRAARKTPWWKEDRPRLRGRD